MVQAATPWTSATRERAHALCALADAMLDRSSALRAHTRDVLAEIADARQRSLDLRRFRQRNKVVVPPARVLTLPPPLRMSGRITRRSVRRALSASSSKRPDDPSPHVEALPSREEWAQSAVYATRIIDVIPAHDVIGEEPVRWTVREIDAGSIPGARGPRCLVFENHRVVRRVWHFPADWANIAPAALLALASSA